MLTPPPVDGPTALPPEVIDSDPFRLFVAYVNEYMPGEADGLPADVAAAVGYVQALADLGEDVEEDVAAWALEAVPLKERRVALRDLATASLWPELAATSIRIGAVARVGDASALPRPRLRLPRLRRRTRSTDKETP